MSLAEGKTIVAAIQIAMVTAQVEQHGEALRACPHCARPRTTKGYYASIFRSIFGPVLMRVSRLRTCPCEETGRASASVLPTGHRPIAPELLYLMAKLAALIPFGKVAMFLDEVLPTATKTHASTVRNRTLRVGQRLERDQDTLPTATPRAPAAEVVLGLDGGYVRNRQPRPERTFEIVAGKVLDDHDQTTRFAFVREGSASGGNAIARLLRHHGTTAETCATVLSDGDAGLRAIQRAAAPTVLVDLVGKGRRVRTVPVPSFVETALRNWLEPSRITPGPVFRRVINGGRVGEEPLTGTTVRAMVLEYAEAAGVRPLAPHALRQALSLGRRGFGADSVAARARRGADDREISGGELELKGAVNDVILRTR